MNEPLPKKPPLYVSIPLIVTLPVTLPFIMAWGIGSVIRDVFFNKKHEPYVSKRQKPPQLPDYPSGPTFSYGAGPTQKDFD